MGSALPRQSLVDQVVAHLKAGFASGRWADHLPGVIQLADELQVSKHVARAAVVKLEEEGWIIDRGPGRPREIVARRTEKSANRALRVAILLSEPLHVEENHSVHTLLGILHAVEAAGHVCFFADGTLTGMSQRIQSISRLVEKTAADAWIVFCGPRHVLEWFAAQSFPVMAFGGRFQDVPIASSATSMGPAIESSMNALRDLGHRRIVLVVPAILRQPTPVPSVAKYLELLHGMGVTPTRYHLPDFEESAEGFERCLTELFRVTPPTALMILDPCYCAAALSFLTRHGLQVPRDVSVVCMMPDPVFRFSTPSLAHFRWPVEPHIRRITRWVAGVATGRPDQRQVILNTEFVAGQTVAPAKR